MDIATWRSLKKEKYKNDKIKYHQPGESSPEYKGLILGYDVNSCTSLKEINDIYENSSKLPDGKSKTFLHNVLERRAEIIVKKLILKKDENNLVDTNKSDNFAESN